MTIWRYGSNDDDSNDSGSDDGDDGDSERVADTRKSTFSFENEIVAFTIYFK